MFQVFCILNFPLFELITSVLIEWTQERGASLHAFINLISNWTIERKFDSTLLQTIIFFNINIELNYVCNLKNTEIFLANLNIHYDKTMKVLKKLLDSISSFITKFQYFELLSSHWYISRIYKKKRFICFQTFTTYLMKILWTTMNFERLMNFYNRLNAAVCFWIFVQSELNDASISQCI